MRFTAPSQSLAAATTLLLSSIPLANAADTRVIESDSLTACQLRSGITAQLFNIAISPGNGTLELNINGVSTINGYVLADIDVIAYGHTFVSLKAVDPCSTEFDLPGLCPLTPGQIPLKPAALPIGKDALADVPGIAYSIPDLDGEVQVKLFNTVKGSGVKGAQVACVRAELSNGKTVYQKGVGWSSAVIAGLALFTSAIVAGLGHSNTATHVAANAMSLFGFFQSQAIFGMTAVALPPIVQAWTQNFQWSMGIIKIGFIQDIASWYQQATGGTPSTLLTNLYLTSVSVQKRSLDVVKLVAGHAIRHFAKRQSTATGDGDQETDQGGVITVRGIERVGFRANIEPTNIFMTAYIFFVIFVMLVCLGVVAFRFILEGLAKAGKMKSDKFQDFRNGWTTVLRGILFRIVLIAFPQMTILCLWELVHADSAGEQALAVVTLATVIIMLAWACGKVWRLAKRSISMHKNPAYILYSDPVCLHKWGFLYVQFKATAYWFIMPWLGFLFIIACFIAFAQSSPITQAIGLLVVNAGFLIGLSILRPYMDKKTNAFNISIAAVNFISAIFLLFFTNIFGLPGLVVGAMGIIFFVLNAAFALILLIMVLIATMFAIFSKNPDVRYQPMRDDRGSFIKSQSQLNTELDALGATARGDTKSPFKREIDGDSSYDNGSMEERQHTGYNELSSPYGKTSQRSTTTYQGATYQDSPYRTGSLTSSVHQQPARTASPWQRGAGYDR